MQRRMIEAICAGLLVMAGVVGPAAGQSGIGTVVAVQGAVNIARAGGTQPGVGGTTLFVDDRLTTDAGGRAKLVLEGDSVLDLGPETDLTIEQLSNHPRRGLEAVLQLRQGTIRVWVGTGYGGREGRYEVETPTAVVSAHGNAFVVRYYTAAEVTEVLGITGDVSVVGRLAVLGGGVQVTAQHYTQVRRGGVPTAPELLSDARLRQYVEGVEILGTGRRDGLNVEHGLVAGRLASPDDVPGRGGAGESGGVAASAPKEFLADQLSQDVRTNTQPLLDFERTPPGQVPPGSVIVGY